LDFFIAIPSRYFEAWGRPEWAGGYVGELKRLEEYGLE